ncbi:MAG: APC family permease [Chitinophagaceae bacterium]
MKLFSKKSLSEISEKNPKKSLKKTLTGIQLIFIGMGATVGAGLFVRTAQATGFHAGNAVLISFMIAAVASSLCALCYAELSAMIPLSGGAYSYAFVAMGEWMAFTVGVFLLMEFTVSPATVAIGFSEYFNKLLIQLESPPIPYQWCHSFFEKQNGIRGILNIPALLLVLMLTFIIIRGVKITMSFNTILVILKIGIILLFIFIGWQYIKPANHIPFFITKDTPPVIHHEEVVADYSNFFNHGLGGILRGGTIVFFAFFGFDAVAISAQETKNPKRNLPIGILGSLLVCTILYLLFAYVFTGIAPFTEYVTVGKEASVTYAIQTYIQDYQWLAIAVTMAILVSFISVILILMMAQSRILFSMANDKLLPKSLSHIHSKYKTPYKSSIITFISTALFASCVPQNIAADITVIGTLMVFIFSCMIVLILRKKYPLTHRPFKVPLTPYLPLLSMLISFSFIVFIEIKSILIVISILLFGWVIYFVRKSLNIQEK